MIFSGFHLIGYKDFTVRYIGWCSDELRNLIKSNMTIILISYFSNYVAYPSYTTY
jgi:hypothetical protein